MTIQEAFPLQEVNSLRSQATDAWAEQISEDLPEGWHISPMNLQPFVDVFQPLTLKPDFVLRAYQFSYHRDGHTAVWALPETAVFPPPDPDSDDEPPKPPEALNNIMAAIQGDGTAWSYLCASIMARESSEIGTFGHGSDWIAYRILDSNPWQTTTVSLSTSPDRGPTGSAAAWQWTAPKPENWLPSVSISENSITVSFYTYCGLGTQVLIHHIDTYIRDSYVSQQHEQVIASGPEGYIW